MYILYSFYKSKYSIENENRNVGQNKILVKKKY